MNRSKTAQLLKEWKTFLSENKNPTFSEDDIGTKVKISIKDDFKKYCKDNKLDKYENMTGTISGHDMNNRDIENEETNQTEEHNFVLVKIGKVKKQFPDKCVERV